VFEELRATIAQKVNELEVGSRFNIRELLGEDWPDGQGAARQLGRDFRANLRDFPEVEYEGRDGGNLSWYRRT